MKKLNNKGFTLIELLAVVVILAVVMGIAMSSVLNSMNNSRKSSLETSVKNVSRAVTAKYSEAMLTGSVSDVYGNDDILGTNNGYDFTKGTIGNPVFYYLSEDLKDDLNISPNTYALHSDSGEMSNPSAIRESFIAFDGEKMVVCLVAKPSGSYYVANATKTKPTAATILSKNVAFDSNVMWSCSNDFKSWDSKEISGTDTNEPEITEPSYKISLKGDENVIVPVHGYSETGLKVTKNDEEITNYSVTYDISGILNYNSLSIDELIEYINKIPTCGSDSLVTITYNVAVDGKEIGTVERTVRFSCQ